LNGKALGFETVGPRLHVFLRALNREPVAETGPFPDIPLLLRLSGLLVGNIPLGPCDAAGQLLRCDTLTLRPVGPRSSGHLTGLLASSTFGDPLGRSFGLCSGRLRFGGFGLLPHRAGRLTAEPQLLGQSVPLCASEFVTLPAPKLTGPGPKVLDGGFGQLAPKLLLVLDGAGPRISLGQPGDFCLGPLPFREPRVDAGVQLPALHTGRELGLELGLLAGPLSGRC
jgi:hypothetical protein